MGTDPKNDYFARARTTSAVGLSIAGVIAIASALMEWVTITPPPVVPPGQEDTVEPFTGIEAGDGWIILAAGILLIIVAPMLLVKRRSGWAWLAFGASVIIGGIAFADYRAIGDFHSGLMQRTGVVGEVDPALGITLAAAAAIAGVIAAVIGIAATPKSAAL